MMDKYKERVLETLSSWINIDLVELGYDKDSLRIRTIELNPKEREVLSKLVGSTIDSSIRIEEVVVNEKEAVVRWKVTDTYM